MKGAVIASAMLMGVGLGHMRLQYPTPRSTQMGINTGPCGDESGDFTGEVTQLEPGFMLVELAYGVPHGSHTYRVSISKEESDTNEDFDSCVILSHVPQFEQEVDRAFLNVSIPDVECNLCAMRVEMITGPDCCNKANGECGTVYYSCANVQISGSTPREELTCMEPCSWPYRDWVDGVFTRLTESDTPNHQFWNLNENQDAVTLNISAGAWIPPNCDETITEPTECRDWWAMTTTQESVKNDDGDSAETGERNGAYSYTTFGNGGKVESDGAVAIVIFLIVAAAIGIAWWKRKQNEVKSAELNGNLNFDAAAV